MSDLQPTPDEKTSPRAEKTSREKTDKLWIAAAFSAILLGGGATGAQANDGLLGGLGGTVNGLTSSVSNTLGGLNNGGNTGGTGLSVASANDIGVSAGDKSADLNASVNASLQKQGQDLGLQGLASQDTAASVNLSKADQATSAHVTSSGAIVLGD